VGADKFHEGDLPTEIESDHEAIIPSCSLESDARAVEDFGLRNSLLDIIRRCPMRGFCQLIPTFERDFRFRVPAPRAGVIRYPSVATLIVFAGNQAAFRAFMRFASSDFRFRRAFLRS
jgi:hypothetical protein